MADPVSATAGQTVQLDPSLLVGATTAKGPSNVLDKDAFLKLLVSQLKYQDPMNPTSNEQFIATTAQFTSIEKLDELAKQGTAAAQISGISTASALVGRQVSILDGGEVRTATVSRGQLASGQVSLVTDLGTVTLDQIVAIGPTVQAAAPTAPPTPAPTPASGGPSATVTDEPTPTNPTPTTESMNP